MSARNLRVVSAAAVDSRERQLLDRLFEPIDLGHVSVANRVVMTAHNGALPPARYLEYLRERARGGVGLVVAAGGKLDVAEYAPAVGHASEYGASFDALYPDPATDEGIEFFDAAVIPLLRDRADAVRAAGARCFGQVYHLGSYKEVDDLKPAIGPSPTADPESFGITHELESDEIERAVLAHAHSVRRVQTAGLDGAEIHAGHGFLVNAFLSPLTNHRHDEWGGDRHGRARFLKRILAESRRLVGPDFPIGLRISASEPFDGGVPDDELVEILKELERDLVYVSVTSGSVSGLRGSAGLAYAASRFSATGHNLAAATRLKSALTIPVIVTGRFLRPLQAAEALESGGCDMVGVVRALIADPQWLEKARTGRTQDIRPCISANECHNYHGARAHLACAVNATAGREIDVALRKPAKSKQVLVIGGGPAGLEAARVAAERGHKVTLLERSSRLGGQLNDLVLDPGQSQLAAYLHHAQRAAETAGVDIRTSTEATVETVLALPAEFVVVATGSVPVVPASATGALRALTATDVLRGAAITGDVLVVGGLDDHLCPLTTAALIARRGHNVELITERLSVAEHADRITRVAALRAAATLGVRVSTSTAFGEATDDCVTLRNLMVGTSEMRKFGTAVFCGERVAQTNLARELRKHRRAVYTIGDAQAPRRIIHAVLDGHRIGDWL
jgi:2,4-dienoyl-CoA reductase-like NADH-dependent reductase (Old Yellow Enzyme family)/thioredoxin reductase